jgi:hypothetical protein
MKKGVILFHSNIKKIYKDRWVSKSVNSMINQKDNDFIFYEINYEGKRYSVIPKNCDIKNIFWSKKLSNHAEAMNFILDKAFEDGCDYVFNTNLDDYYDESRISSQLKMAINENLDIVSSDFCYIQETDSDEDTIMHIMNIEKTNIKENLENKHNIIAHPAVCYSKNFWNDSKNRYDITKLPEEDLDLWVRSIRNGYNFGIHNDILLHYRIHKNQISAK